MSYDGRKVTFSLNTGRELAPVVVEFQIVVGSEMVVRVFCSGFGIFYIVVRVTLETSCNIALFAIFIFLFLSICLTTGQNGRHHSDT